MEEPVEPKKEDCCNSGCNPCIFDVYAKQVKVYQQYTERGKSPDEDVLAYKNNGISQLEYTGFELVKNTKICESHKLLLFKRNIDNKKVFWKPADHFLFKFVSKEVSCTRAYTPFKIKDSVEDHDFAIVLKVYVEGLISNILYNLKEGEVTLWRGPYGSYELIPNKFDRIVMIAQGTGIATFISVIEKVLDNEDDMTKIVLLYCTKSAETILFRDELYDFQQYWNYTYKIFLGRSSENTSYKYQEPIIRGKMNHEHLVSLVPLTSMDQFLVCGSAKFMREIKENLRNVKCSVNNIITF